MAEFHRGVRKQIQSHFWIYRVHQKKNKKTSGTIPFSLLPGVTSWVWLRASFIPEFRTFRAPQRWGGGGGEGFESGKADVASPLPD